MKILWVKAGKILPVDTGGRIRSFNVLRQLIKEHSVTLLSYYGGDPDPAYEASIAEQLPGAHTIHTAAPEGTLTQRLDYVLQLASPAPYAVKKFTDSKVRRTVLQWIGEKRFDVAVCDFLSASLNFPHKPPAPSVLFQHNVETVLWKRLAETESSTARKLAYRIEAVKMAHYEKRALARFDHVIAVSEQDRHEMLRLDARCRISVVPTGVDTQRYAVAPSASADPPILVFTGSMDWEPNIDAVEFFNRDIWPSLLHAFPNARFQIVGRNPHVRVRRLQSDSIEVTGTVPSVADYLRTATVVVVPLRIGGGTRLKIFEAMAMGKAVVSTSIGAEGLDVTHGRDLLIADSAETFSAAISDLLRNPGLRRNYENAAAASAARHDWSEISHTFADVLRESISAFHAR